MYVYLLSQNFVLSILAEANLYNLLQVLTFAFWFDGRCVSKLNVCLFFIGHQNNSSSIPYDDDYMVIKERSKFIQVQATARYAEMCLEVGFLLASNFHTWVWYFIHRYETALFKCYDQKCHIRAQKSFENMTSGVRATGSGLRRSTDFLPSVFYLICCRWVVIWLNGTDSKRERPQSHCNLLWRIYIRCLFTYLLLHYLISLFPPTRN
jgi:hypothetical protein